MLEMDPPEKRRGVQVRACVLSQTTVGKAGMSLVELLTIASKPRIIFPGNTTPASSSFRILAKAMIPSLLQGALHVKVGLGTRRKPPPHPKQQLQREPYQPGAAVATVASLRLAPGRVRHHHLTNACSLHKVLEKVAQCPSSCWGTQSNLDVLFPPVKYF